MQLRTSESKWATSRCSRRSAVVVMGCASSFLFPHQVSSTCVCSHICVYTISDLLCAQCAHIHMRVCTCACTHVQICTHVYVDLIFVSRVDAHKRILAPFPLSISLFPPAPVLPLPLSLPPFGSLTSALALGTLIAPSTNAPSSPPFREPRFGGTPTPPEHALTRAHAHAHTHTRTHVHDHRRS